MKKCVKLNNKTVFKIDFTTVIKKRLTWTQMQKNKLFAFFNLQLPSFIRNSIFV